MNTNEDNVLGILNELYATGLGERSWLDTLSSINALFGGAGVNAFDFSRPTGAPTTCYIGDGNDVGRSDYIDHIHSIDPRLQYVIARQGPMMSCDYDALPEEAMRRHEYYDWLGRVCGMKYHIGAKFIDDGDVFSCISIELGIKHGPPEREDFNLLGFLAPHIANSWRMSQRLAQAARVDDFNLALLETVPWGVVTIDHSGRVLSANSAARKIVNRGDGLRIEHRSLCARRPADDRRLQGEIGLSLKTARGEGLHPGGKLAIGRQDKDLPYGVRVMPLKHVTGMRPQGVPFVAVVIADLVEPQLPDTEDLVTFLGFSLREAEVVLLVAKGLPPADVAKTLRISAGTVRTHLSNAMAKAGTNRRSALVGLIHSLPGRYGQS
ncbi:LuxR C-terminal-related transcriptional regulator [Nitratireductor sp. XY-223]|uniref:helix-turn-helix transcriptional regulator n=1 Tax=Nitratireductor sp. XY-223 TaxID=2561926 RepID=UPI0010AA143D|nr:LuxR C-terminal-related transcriptional regulator [Nitratireductor sp. XY-223]